MAEVNTKEAIFTSQMNKQTNAKKEILLGICLFVGMNYVFAFVGSILVNLFAGLGKEFYTDPAFFRDLSIKVVLGSVCAINAAIFAYLVVKRPLMSTGILAVIPALVLLWCAGMVILLLLLVALYILQFLIGILIFLFIFVLPWVLLGCAIVFILSCIIKGINIALLLGSVAIILFKKMSQHSG